MNIDFDTLLNHGKILKSGILIYKLDDYFDFLKYVQELCLATENNTPKEIIFKCYVLAADHKMFYDLVKGHDIKEKNNILSDVIYYCKSENQLITLLAKTKYYLTNKKMDFLKVQILELSKDIETFKQYDIINEAFNHTINVWNYDKETAERINEEILYKLKNYL